MRPIQSISTVLLISLFSLSGFALAQNQVYVCTDPNGNKEYRNTGSTKGCAKVELPSITTVPASQMRSSGGNRGNSNNNANSPSEENFPKVDPQTQRARDNDRRQVLEQELQKEQKKLEDLKKEYNNGQPERLGSERNYAKYQERVKQLQDNISRTEQNIESIQREIKGLRAN